MIKNACSAIVLLLVLFLCACAKKEAPAAKEEAAATPAKAAPVPGEMVLIPAGEFIFGSNDDKNATYYPEQKINLPAFWIDKYEVTGKEMLDFAVATGYAGEGAREGKDWRLFVTAEKAYNPVVYITWDDASAFCKWAGKRLPTEQEWEKAARGADGRKYPWGNEWKTNLSNTFEEGLRASVPIGKYEGDVSPYGAHDMLGNVQEWTSSWYRAYKGSTKSDPNYGERWRVLRGASYIFYGQRYPIWLRSASLPGSLYDYGCRCAKDATPEEAAKAGQTK